MTRFVIAMFVMIGCLMFLGCPFRMILRLAGGDFNALFGILGFVGGILAGCCFPEKRIYSEAVRSYSMQIGTEGTIFTVLQLVILALLVAAPAFIHFTENGWRPWGKARCNRDLSCGRTGGRCTGTENKTLYGRRYP